MSATATPFRIGLVLFPRMTQLDATAPYEVFARIPGAETHLVAATREPVVSEHGLAIVPTATFDDAPPLDLICVPGGAGIGAFIENDRALDYVAREGARAAWVTSVCTGALVLGAAGLLDGYRATTHWLSLDLLATCGAIPVAERVVRDRNRVTGGGVTAGLDFALVIASLLRGDALAERTQLLLEYDPAPPFDSGSPVRAAAALTTSLRAERAEMQRSRRAALESAMRRRAGRVIP